MSDIVLDISGRLVNAQEMLKELQSVFDKIDVSKGAGKQYAKMFADAQKAFEKTSSNTTRRVTSELGIEKVNDEVNNVYTKILQTADAISHIGIENLNFSTLGADAQQTVEQIQQIKQEVESLESSMSGKGTGLQQWASRSSAVKEIFKEMGVEIKSLNNVEIGKKLQQNLTDAQEATKKATVEVQKYKQELETIEQKITNIQQKEQAIGKLTQSKDLISDPVTGKVDLDKKDFDAGAAEQSLKTFQEGLQSRIQTMIDGLTGQRGQKGNISKLQGLQETINKMFTINPDAINSAQSLYNIYSNIVSQLKTLKNPLNDSAKFFTQQDLSQYGRNAGFLNKQGQLVDFAQTFSKQDEATIERYRKEAESVLQDYKLNFSDDKQYSSQIDKLIEQLRTKKDNLNELFAQVAQVIKTGDEKIAAARQDAEKDKGTTTENLQKAQIEQVNAETREQKASKGVDLYERRLSQAQNRIVKLEDTIKELRSQLEGKGSSTLGQLQGTAGNIKTGASEELAKTNEYIQKYNSQLSIAQERTKALNKVEGLVQRWFSIYTVVRMVRKAYQEIINTIKELDKTMTEIAIVTDMSQADLWKQVPQYTEMARQYGASISGVYKVSQLYYQQGLQTVDVMKLTSETLKMARISGLDYEKATNYMTNALRSFKMSMQDAGHIVDVYSALAASAATSVTELAKAMSKTASSAEAVGSSFENTSAMMAVMIEATREAPENIGSAMKSIISRYGELKEDPTKLVDSEGEELSLNKVDTALKSVGISIHDAAGQFRDFDDVIMELAASWNTIDKNTQRYIATVMA